MPDDNQTQDQAAIDAANAAASAAAAAATVDAGSAAPDTVTAATAAATAAAVKAGATEDDLNDAAATARDAELAALAKVKTAFYVTTNGGIITDPFSAKPRVFGPEPVKSEMNSWLKLQIENGKIVKDE